MLCVPRSGLAAAGMAALRRRTDRRCEEAAVASRREDRRGPVPACWNIQPVVCVLALSTFAPHASSNDRPYQATWTAVADEDDDGLWSIESWATWLGSQRTFTLAPEYAFSPTTNLQLELTRVRTLGVDDAATLAELEFKHLFNHIARDGYGTGIVVTLGANKARGAGWRGDEWSVKLPLSVSLWEGQGLLHVNASIDGFRDEKHQWTAALALEREVWRRTTLFGELARVGDTTLLHGGVRYWIKREKWAVDFSLQRVRADGRQQNGGVLGINWYDL